MTTAICYSKNRACQLDLLLRSIQTNAPDLFDDITVIWKADDAYRDGYRSCLYDSHGVVFWPEEDLRAQTLQLVAEAGEHVAFLMDDCVFYRPIDAERDPVAVLADEDVLCFSPRLGLNTLFCYPLDRRQELPPSLDIDDGFAYWPWQDAEADYSYPFSLDSHIFRRDDLLPLLCDVYDWSTPNSLEAALASMGNRLERPLMAAHVVSHLVGIPANRVSRTHETNRAGETFSHDPSELNRAYLAGKRISLDSIDPLLVNAAHVEFPLRLA